MTSDASPLYNYMQGIEGNDTQLGYIIKTVNVRELIAQLPTPANMNRNLSTVPDVKAQFILSSTSKLPRFIQDKVNASNNPDIGNEHSLAGLCMSGRSLPVEIFLHQCKMMEDDPSGELFDEVCGHEVVHGIEGISTDDNGQIVRKEPWSYKLQQAMLEIDKAVGHTPSYQHPALDRYLREGLDLQDNVSELFARAAEIFQYKIKSTGLAPDPQQDPMWMMNATEPDNLDSRETVNTIELLVAFQTFSTPAQRIFVENSIEMHQQILNLWGYEPIT